MIDTLIDLDTALTLHLNAWRSDFMDPIMVFISGKKQWIPLYIALLIGVSVGRSWKQRLGIVLGIGLVILLADRISSGFFKPYFERFRPSQDPVLKNLVHIVNDYRGGLYGFLSSHAANSFGLATFLSFFFRQRWIKIGLLVWAVVVAYSRVYLGVHYLGDIVCGALLGVGIAYGVYWLHQKYASKIVDG